MESENTEDFGFDSESDFELDENTLRSLKEDKGQPKTGKSNFVKEELRLKIQARRISEGQSELQVEFEPPPKYQLTPEEELKLEIRRQRNRRSANKSRLKRKWKYEQLSQQESILTEEHQKLKAEVNALQKFKGRLETVLSNHMPKCVLNTSETENKITKTFDEFHHVPVGGGEFKKPQESSIRASNGGALSEMTSVCHNLSRQHFRNLSKDQKITALKAYLKGNETQTDVYKFVGKVNMVNGLADHNAEMLRKPIELLT